MRREFWTDLSVGSLIAIFGLTVLAAVSQEYWQFAVVALVGWSIADLTFEAFDKQPAVNVQGFLVFVVLIIIVTMVGIWLSNELLLFLRLNWLISALIVNSVAAILTFLATSYDIKYKLQYGK